MTICEGCQQVANRHAHAHGVNAADGNLGFLLRRIRQDRDRYPMKVNLEGWHGGKGGEGLLEDDMEEPTNGPDD